MKIRELVDVAHVLQGKLLGMTGSNPGTQEARFAAKAIEHGTGLCKVLLDLSLLVD